MTKIETAPDCGNSPKNEFLLELTIALARADFARIADAVTEDIRWLPAGRKAIEGRDAFIKAITRYGPAKSLAIDHVISHGKAGAVDGIVEFGRKQRAFCFVFEFASAKGARVSGMSSYSVPIS